MNKARKLLSDAALMLDLPADILAGLPKMEITGFQEFSIEPHRGLMEYDKDQIGVDTNLGKIWVIGNDLGIKLMNRERITIKGKLLAVKLQEADHV